MPDMWIDVDTAVTVPVNLMPLIDDTDFKTRETGVAYNAAGMDLVWNFVTSAGVITQTAVTPTTAGDYDWTHVGDGIYKIEIPASGGASINNDTEGYGWFSGVATGVLPWRGPVIGFRAAALNNALCDGGDTLDVNVTEWLGTAAATPTVAGVPEVDVTHWIGTAAATPTTAGVPEVDITHVAGAAVNTASAQLGVNVVNAAGTAWGSGAITAASIAADAITAAKIADGAIDAATFAAGAITAAAIATNAIDADAIAADAVTEIQAGLATPTNITAGTITTVTNLTNAPTNGDLTATMKTSVNTEALNALVTHRLDELLNADSDIDGAAPPTVGSVFHELLTKSTGSFTYDQTTDSLEAIKDAGGGGLDAAGVRAAVGLASANLDTQLAAIDDAVDTEVAAIKVVTDKLGTAVELDGAVYRFTANALEQAPAGAAGSVVLGPEYA